MTWIQMQTYAHDRSPTQPRAELNNVDTCEVKMMQEGFLLKVTLSTLQIKQLHLSKPEIDFR